MTALIAFTHAIPFASLRLAGLAVRPSTGLAVAWMNAGKAVT